MQEESVVVEGGGVPVFVQGPADPSQVPGLVVVPSIFGPAPDLLKQMSELADSAFTVVTDPFWRVSSGVVPYDDLEGAMGRLKGFDIERCYADVQAVAEWTGQRCNGRVAGLGICFGGPVVLIAAAAGSLAGVVTWHGTHMENVLERVGQLSCPLRFHFGSADPVTPPDVIEKVRAAFAGNPDVRTVVHPGLEHGFSHEGSSCDPAAAQAGVDETRALLATL